MSEYLDLAEELEKDAEVSSVSLEKIASLCLLYEYFNNPNFTFLSSPAFIKNASKAIDEDNLVLNFGVELGIRAITNEEN